MTGFILVIASSFFHATWNAFLKNAQSKHHFNLYMHYTSMVALTVIILLFFRGSISFDPYVWGYGAIAGAFFSIYQVMVAKAYELSDVSQVYPITTSSPIFVVIWAAIFLHEKLPYVGLFGILVTLAGCLLMNKSNIGQNTHTKRGVSRGVIFAFMAAFAYSFGALLDKVGANSGNTIAYSYAMNLTVTIILAVYYFFNRSTGKLSPKDMRMIWPCGLALAVSTILYRVGVEYMYISYAVAVRQMSSIFALLIGVYIFREGYARRRFLGTAIILTGIIIIRFNM